MLLTAPEHVRLTRRPFPSNPEGHLVIRVIKYLLPLRNLPHNSQPSASEHSSPQLGLALTCLAGRPAQTVIFDAGNVNRS